MDEFVELGDTINKSIQRIVHDNNSVCVELGTIGADLSLTTDSFPIPIPKGEYMVNALLSSVHGIQLTGSGTHGGHDSGNGSHEHSLDIHTVSAGDRVLVAWAGNEPVVIAVVTSSGNI